MLIYFPTAISCTVIMNTAPVVCGHPLQDRVSTPDSEGIEIMNYVAPAIEGTTVTFKCLSQYDLIGPNTTVCMENGEWEPDPREVECKGKAYATKLLTLTTKGVVNFYDDNSTIAWRFLSIHPVLTGIRIV